jgi:beta-glucosidase
LERIWRAKQKIFTLDVEDSGTHQHDWEHRPPASIRLDWLAQPSAQAAAAQILEQSAQGRGVIPEVEGFARNVIVVDELIGCDVLNRRAPAIAIPQQHGYQTLLLIDNHCPTQPQALRDHPEPTLLQLFIRGNPFRGSAGLSKLAKDWVDALLESGQLKGLMIYGSPYILETFLPLLPPDMPYGFSYGQMPMAQAIALETRFSTP